MIDNWKRPFFGTWAIAAAFSIAGVRSPHAETQDSDLDQSSIATTAPAQSGNLRGETEGIWFGFVGNDGFAIEDETWTWDHGSADPFEGWVELTSPSFMGIAAVTNYGLSDDCGMSGNVLEMHDDALDHPNGRLVRLVSNPVNVDRDVHLPGDGPLRIEARWKQYSEMTSATGSVFRPGWQYYPYVDPESGDIGWSSRVGQSTYWYDEGCRNYEVLAQATLFPEGVEQVRFVYEFVRECVAFGTPPCPEEAFAPLVDDLQIGFFRDLAPADIPEDPATSDVSVRLETSAPNPFTRSILLRFRLAEPQVVSVTILDASGRNVRSLLHEDRSAGAHEISWDGRNDAGVLAPSGVYWTRLATASTSVNERIVLRR